MHPFEATSDLQVVYWSAFEIGKIYEVELISFYEAQTHQFAKGAYTTFCAKILHHCEKPVLIEGDVFKMHISYREFVRSLNELHIQFRKPLARNLLGKNNVYIKFQKTSRQSMKILSIEPRENDGKYNEECAEVYLERKFREEVPE